MGSTPTVAPRSSCARALDGYLHGAEVVAASLATLPTIASDCYYCCRLILAFLLFPSIYQIRLFWRVSIATTDIAMFEEHV